MHPIYFLILIPLLAPFVVLHLTKTFNKEFLPLAGMIASGFTVVLTVALAVAVNYTPRDTETLNGFVTGKDIHKFQCPVNTANPCENDYNCNCRIIRYSCGTSDSPQTCTRQECDKCYVYPWEQNFFVHSSLQGDRAYKISRIDRQGALEPPRWREVKINDPVSIKNSYVNYILGAVDSLFAEDGEAEVKYKSVIPAYPQGIFDYYKIDRLVTVGNVTLDRKAWNETISHVLVHVGPRKQANIIVVVAEGVDMDFANAVRRSWRGFKKNDIVVFAGVDAAGKMEWARVMSWSKESMVNIKMESDLLQAFQGKQLELDPFMTIVKGVSLAHFERRPMEEFKYLKDSYTLSGTKIFWMVFLTLLMGAGAVALQFHTLQGTRSRNYNLRHFRFRN